ncbi:MAG: hypothetical protein NTZ05_10885 [Chloroflexi bacterium]|nr:hypothetical protein [Chloroflexota bacterium]
MGLDTSLHPDFGTVWEGDPIGIPYMVVAGAQPTVPVRFEYADESDPGPYPIPADAPIEGGPGSDGDRHILIVDRDNWKLYELFAAYPEQGGARWRAGSGAIFDLASNALRPGGWTSADAAGLPIFPGLVRYDEAVEQGAILHALRFTARRTQRAYVAPARHYAGSITDPNVPPMGTRVRLRASFDTSSFPPAMRAILKAMQTYGMLLADNGSDWYVSGAPDPRWNDDELRSLRRVRGRDFEVVLADQAPPPPPMPTHVKLVSGEGAIPEADFKFSIGERADGACEGWLVHAPRNGGHLVSAAIHMVGVGADGQASVWGDLTAPDVAGPTPFNLVVSAARYHLTVYRTSGEKAFEQQGPVVDGAIRVAGKVG